MNLNESHLKKIVRRVISEQFWMSFIEFMSHEGPGLGWGPDINFNGYSDYEPGDPEGLKKVKVDLKNTRTKISNAQSSKNKINNGCSTYTNIKKPGANAGEIQDFLISIGHKITKDWSFGDSTATAVGTYFYGASAGINSVYKLWNKLNQDGWDVGTKSGFGPKMATAISTIITRLVNKIQTKCTTELNKVNNLLNTLRKTEKSLTDLEYKYSPKTIYKS